MVLSFKMSCYFNGILLLFLLLLLLLLLLVIYKTALEYSYATCCVC